MTQLLRRTELAVPASNDHMFAKALSCDADLVFLDLEDAVPPAFKEESREKAIAALTELYWGPTTRAVRINGLDTKWCHDDIIEVVSHGRYSARHPRRAQGRLRERTGVDVNHSDPAQNSAVPSGWISS